MINDFKSSVVFFFRLIVYGDLLQLLSVCHAFNVFMNHWVFVCHGCDVLSMIYLNYKIRGSYLYHSASSVRTILGIGENPEIGKSPIES